MKHVFLFYLVITVIMAKAQQGGVGSTDLPASVKLAPAVQPPAIVSEKFSLAYPNTRADWTASGEVYTAMLPAGQGSVQAVRYSREGRLLETIGRVEHSRYPRNIRRFLEDDPGGPSRSLWMRKDSAGTLTYFSPDGGDTLWFDAAGRYAMRRAATMNEDDVHFLRNMAALQIMEASMAALALVNGTERSIAGAPARMDCLGKRQAALESLAAAKSVRLPADLLPKQKKDFDRLAALQGRDFDRAYAKMSRKTKKRLDRGARRALRSGDPEIRSAAARGLNACS